MCGRFGYTNITLRDGTQKWIRLIQEIPSLDVKKIDSLFKIISGSENFPGARAPILRLLNSSYHLDMITWGIKPDWSPKLIFNTRVEKLFSSNFWGKIAHQQRCIIPASYFLEWKSEDGMKIRQRVENGNKADFCFAGIWGTIENIQENDHTASNNFESATWFTILTQEGNSLMKEIHNTGGNQGRQPIQIEAENLESWLDPKISSESAILNLIVTYPSESIVAFPETDQPSLFL